MLTVLFGALDVLTIPFFVSPRWGSQPWIPLFLFIFLTVSRWTAAAQIAEHLANAAPRSED